MILFICLTFILSINKFNMPEIQLPKSIKKVSRHQDIKQLSQPVNIFANIKNNQKPSQHINSSYDIVGDHQFKKKFYSCRGTQKMNKTIDQFKPLQQTNLNSTFCNYSKTIQDGTLARKLSMQKQLYLTRNRRTFSQFQTNKSREQSIKKHLQRRLSNFGRRKIQNTMTFGKKQIQIEPNPELIDLINDNIPEYWKNSLRDNQKRLKRHVKGNSFRNQVAQQMLQTLRGRKKLTSTIPKIKPQFFSPICTRQQQEPKYKKAFGIKGRKIKEREEDLPQKYNCYALKQIPRIQFEQVHKIKYDSANRWQGYQLC